MRRKLDRIRPDRVNWHPKGSRGLLRCPLTASNRPMIPGIILSKSSLGMKRAQEAGRRDADRPARPARAGRTMVTSPAAPSPVRFSGLLFADSGADDGARAVGATDDDDVGFATYGVDRSTMANSQALTWCAWLRSRRARLRKISGIWQRYSYSLPSRARE